MGYLGGLLAVVLFEFVYKRAMTIVQEEEGDEEPMEEAEQNLLQARATDTPSEPAGEVY